MDPATLVNIVLTAPLLAALIGLMVSRKIVFGWTLDEQRRLYEERSAEVKASYAREIEVRDQHIKDLRADLLDATREIRETTPVLTRTNDALRATQDLLRDFLRRSTG